MKNKKIFNYLILEFSILFFVVNLVYYIQSYSYYSDEYGTDISFDTDSLVGMIVGVCLIVCSSIFLTKESHDFKQKSLYVCGLVITSLYTFYPLSVFIKAFVKAMAKGEAFIFTEHQDYLYIGILSLVLFAAALIKFVNYLKDRKDI